MAKRVPVLGESHIETLTAKDMAERRRLGFLGHPENFDEPSLETLIAEESMDDGFAGQRKGTLYPASTTLGRGDA